MRFWVVVAAMLAVSPACAQEFGSMSGATSSINITNPSATTSTNRLITVPSIGAPGLAAAGVETCLGSSSGGLSLMGGGFTFGSTSVDDGCTIRLLSRQLFAFGMQRAAVALMCQDDRVARAMETSGSPCPSVAGKPMIERKVSAVTEGHILTLDESRPAPMMVATRAISRAEQAWMDRASN